MNLGSTPPVSPARSVTLSIRSNGSVASGASSNGPVGSNDSRSPVRQVQRGKVVGWAAENEYHEWVPMSSLSEASETPDPLMESYHRIMAEQNQQQQQQQQQQQEEASSNVGAHKPGLVASVGLIPLFCFWIFGLCNNYGYVVMLSAAEDILSRSDAGRSLPTGAILVVDILPTFFTKICGPFVVHRFSYSLRICLCVVMAASSFLIVADGGESESGSLGLSLFGVALASAASGLGEITFLSLTSHFHKLTVGAWSSGTGGAGILGAFSYAFLTQIFHDPATTLRWNVVVPIAMGLSYVLLLYHWSTREEVDPHTQRGQGDEETGRIMQDDSHADYAPLIDREENDVGVDSGSLDTIQTNRFEEGDEVAGSIPAPRISSTTFHDLPLLSKLKSTRLLVVPYMIPLFLVYLAEYLINQGVVEHIAFKPENNVYGLTREEQYRWYQAIYQTGVFVSRSSIACVTFHRLLPLAVLQFVNLAVLFADAYFRILGSLSVIFMIIFWEGLLGGATYVNAFHDMSERIRPKSRLEFSLSVASVADSAGISTASMLSFVVNSILKGRDQPRR
eukprot:Clim_evm16s108 gene=Clim_evmTU16s108